MSPEEIQLENLSKNFEYEKISREIDLCQNNEQLKNIAKSYVKLYFKQQEVISKINF
jgi:hypothetical protein